MQPEKLKYFKIPSKIKDQAFKLDLQDVVTKKYAHNKKMTLN